MEATSLACLESLALGVPVIASDIGGLAEIDGGKGILQLTPPGSEEAIAVRLEQVYASYLSDTIDRERLRARIKEGYDVDAWTGKVAEVYRKALYSGTAGSSDRVMI